MMTSAKAAITGVGMSDIGRNTGRPAMRHLAEAAERAMARSGLTRADIDGICNYPGKADKSPGMSPLGTGEVRGALGLQTRWHSAVPDGPAQMAPIMVAAMAVMTGQARHVLCFGALTESSSQSAGRRASIPGGGQLSGGRLHGFGLLHEACVQLWGEGDARQVAEARTAVCGMGGGFIAGAMLPHRD